MSVEFKQAKYRWINPLTREEISSQVDNNQRPYLKINETNGYIIKAGIQAPPGTCFKVQLLGENTPIEIMVGRTGVLELEYEGLVIKKIELALKKKYEYDEEASKKAIEDGEAKMNAALEKAKKEDYDKEAFLSEYINGYNIYRSGVKGIYKKSIEDQEVDNILIDYIIEKDKGVY